MCQHAYAAGAGIYAEYVRQGANQSQLSFSDNKYELFIYPENCPYAKVI